MADHHLDRLNGRQNLFASYAPCQLEAGSSAKNIIDGRTPIPSNDVVSEIALYAE